MKIKINLNDEVKVKLTDFGIKVLKHRHEDGYYKTQLHNLMNTFGEYTTLARELPFETEIEIVGG